jgi:ion channel-forming bestrophin family protein
MILRDSVRPMFSSSTLVQTGLLTLGWGAYSALPVLKELSIYKSIGDMPSELHAAMSLVLGALLIFRTNSAYSRWWEARTLWGSLVNSTRNLSLKLSSMLTLSPEDAEMLRMTISEFPRYLMHHLRFSTQSKAPTGPIAPAHLPLNVAQKLYDWVGQQRQLKAIDGFELNVIDQELAKFMEICGGCERIARTPFVRTYRVFARQCVVLFLVSFPWGVAEDFKWWTIPLTMIIAYFMVGMEIVAEHVEEPFGYEDDDLDLEGLCDTIEQSVHAIFRNARSSEAAQD